MDVRTSEDYFHFVYDPALYGFNTAYWKELNGTGALSGSNKIRVNTVAIVSKHQYLRGDFTFKVNIPSDPGGAHRIWGLKLPNVSSDKNAAYFEIIGGVFRAVLIDENGVTSTSTITWDSSSWSGVDIAYRIQWIKGRVIFSISGIPVALFDDRNYQPGNQTLSLWVENSDSDAMDVAYISLAYVEKVFVINWESPVTPTTNERVIEGAKDQVTLTDVVTMSMTTGDISVSDQLTVTDAPDVYINSRDISVNDQLTITESSNVAKIVDISVSDQITVSENTTFEINT